MARTARHAGLPLKGIRPRFSDWRIYPPGPRPIRSLDIDESRQRRYFKCAIRSRETFTAVGVNHTSYVHPEVRERGRQCAHKGRWRAVVYGCADNVAGLAAQTATVFHQFRDIQVVRDPIQEHLDLRADRVPIDG